MNDEELNLNDNQSCLDYCVYYEAKKCNPNKSFGKIYEEEIKKQLKQKDELK